MADTHKKRTVLFTWIAIAGSCVLLLAFFGVKFFIIQPIRYSDALELIEDGEYESAIIAFEELGNYRNSAAKVKICQYSIAIQKEERKEYQDAIELFEKLADYKDSVEHVEKCSYALVKQYAKSQDYSIALEYVEKAGSLSSAYEAKVLKILAANVGDTVVFGSYEQDNDVSNGTEDIEWTIIDVDGANIKLLSNKNLECKKYNDTWSDITWENCTLRQWLNVEFYISAFDDNEKSALVNDFITGDMVYILSAKEWTECAASGGTLNTDYAIANGVYNSNGKGWTWLRDTGVGQDHAQEIDCEGNVNAFGSFVDCDNDGVRPVITISGGDLYE